MRLIDIIYRSHQFLIHYISILIKIWYIISDSENLNDYSSINALNDLHDLHSQFIDIEENKIYDKFIDFYHDVIPDIARYRPVSYGFNSKFNFMKYINFLIHPYLFLYQNYKSLIQILFKSIS